MKNNFWRWNVLFFSVFLFFSGCAAKDAESLDVAAGFLEPSQMFVLKDTKENTVSLKDLLKEKKAVLINFWATWCPPCLEEIPGLIDLQQKYGGTSFTILGVDVGESKERVDKFIQKSNINYPILLDSDQKVAEAYRVVGIPTSLLVNSEGKVLGVYHAYTKKLVSDVEKALI